MKETGMDQPLTIIVVAGFELIVLSLVTMLYYYEAIRGSLQGSPALARKAERMFALGSALLVPNFLAMGPSASSSGCASSGWR